MCGRAVRGEGSDRDGMVRNYGGDSRSAAVFCAQWGEQGCGGGPEQLSARLPSLEPRKIWSWTSCLTPPCKPGRSWGVPKSPQRVRALGARLLPHFAGRGLGGGFRTDY